MNRWKIRKIKKASNAENEWEAYEDGTRGSFNQYIAKAFMVADESNEEKLAKAFPEIAKVYRNWKYGGNK